MEYAVGANMLLHLFEHAAAPNDVYWTIAPVSFYPNNDPLQVSAHNASTEANSM